MVDIVYTAMSALLVVVVLHVAVFWVTRFIQPPKPKIVYLPAAQQQPQQQPVMLPQQPVQQLPPPPAIQLPTYDSPPAKAAPPALPPPIETRESKGSALPQPGLPHPSV